MIRVKRFPTPKVLNGPESRGGRERARWMDYHTGKRKTKPGDFKAYSDEGVVLVLRGMFKRKCAYCESRIAAGDVEHWRPKNAIIRDDGTRLEDGYWWLAADWDNLLYACVTCNQRRRQEMHGVEGLVTAGKGAQFPIANEVEVKGPGDEKIEEPLLVNPTKERPEKHMVFVVEPGKEDEGCVQPVELEGGELDPKGETSIEVLGLNNFALVERRREKLADLREPMRRVERLTMQIDQLDPGLGRDRLSLELKGELHKLASFLSGDREDVMLSCQVILPFMKRIQGG